VAHALVEYDEREVRLVLEQMERRGFVERSGASGSQALHYKPTVTGWKERELLIRKRGRRVRCLANQRDYPLTDLIVALLMSGEDAERINKPSGSFLHDWPPKMAISVASIYLCEYSRDELANACSSLIAAELASPVRVNIDNTRDTALQPTLKGQRLYWAQIKSALGLGDKEFILMENRRDRVYVFYAWQSDYAESNRTISRALDDWAAGANANWPLVAPLAIDRATMPGEGAVRIDVALQEKIVRADFFVGDVTPTFNFRCRLCPNPNVLIEIGYALARKTPEQILLLEHRLDVAKVPGDGSAGNLPFDIDHVHRWPFNSESDLLARLEAEMMTRFRNRGLLHEDPCLDQEQA
jgi:hypothetical protein